MQVLVERKRRAVEHVGVEQRIVAARDAPSGVGEQRPQEVLYAVGRAVVGVQGDEDGARLGDDVRVLRR
jgi:hypothetical protein